MFHVEHLDGFGGVIGQKAPSPPDGPGWFLGPSRRKRKNLWSATSQRQYRRKKVPRGTLDGALQEIGQKAPSLPDRPGWFLGPSRRKRKKPLACRRPKAIPKKEKVPRGTLKGTLQELDKRLPPCQKGRADCFGRAEGKKISLWPTASQRHDR